MSRCKSVTALYAVCHFAVDLGCAYAVFSACSAGKMGFLLYNFCAFALQMPLGLLADAWGRNHRFAVLGILLTATMCLFPSFGLAGATVLGLGNALFHIGGGLDVLNLSVDSAAPLGVFVSPGALGLYIGTLWGKFPIENLARLPVVALLLGLAVLTACRLEGSPLPGNAPLEFPKKSLYPWAALLFLVVVLRSWGGIAAAFPWKTGPWSLTAVLAVVLGKTMRRLRLGPAGQQKGHDLVPADGVPPVFPGKRSHLRTSGPVPLQHDHAHHALGLGPGHARMQGLLLWSSDLRTVPGLPAGVPGRSRSGPLGHGASVPGVLCPAAAGTGRDGGR